VYPTVYPHYLNYTKLITSFFYSFYQSKHTYRYTTIFDYTHYMTTIPIPDMQLAALPPSLFTLPPNDIIQSTNNKFFKFYLFTLWFISQFKHQINHHDFNLIVQSIIFSFHHNIHNTFFTHLNHIKLDLHSLFMI